MEVWGDKIIMEQQNESGERRMWVKAGGCGYRLQNPFDRQREPIQYYLFWIGIALCCIVFAFGLIMGFAAGMFCGWDVECAP